MAWESTTLILEMDYYSCSVFGRWLNTLKRTREQYRLCGIIAVQMETAQAEVHCSLGSDWEKKMALSHLIKKSSSTIQTKASDKYCPCR